MSLRYLFACVIVSGIASIVPETANADCNNCCSNNCCRPNRTKIINRFYGSGCGFCGAMPPQGYAVASMPAVMVQTPAFAATPALAVTPATFTTTANTASIDYSRLAEELRRQNAAPATAAPTAAPAAAGTKCDDACGRILQLEQDVRDLIGVTNRLTVAVEKLAQNSAK